MLSKSYILISLLLLVLFSVPFFAGAALVPCGNNTTQIVQNGEWVTVPIECTLSDFFVLVDNIIDFLLTKIALPLAAIGFAWGGALYLTAAGNTGQIEKAHGIFKNIIIGFLIALAAWLIVSAILTGLGVTGAFNLLE